MREEGERGVREEGERPRPPQGQVVFWVPAGAGVWLVLVDVEVVEVVERGSQGPAGLHVVHLLGEL